MILQALTAYYEALAAAGKAPLPGWATVRVSYALEIDSDGTLIGVHSLKTEEKSGKKTVWLPRSIELPAPVKRTAGIRANFMCDNASYMLGFEKNGGTHAAQCFESAAKLHIGLLADADSPATAALVGFFESYDITNPPEMVTSLSDELSGGANLVFMYDGRFIHDEPKIREIWQKRYDSQEDGEEMVCLVTGEKTVPMAVHPALKGVRDAQSSGAALVSFNAPAYESFDRVQNLNAPVGKYASFAYTTALNRLVADRAHNLIIGDSTVVYWAENGEQSYQDLYTAFLDGQSDRYTDEDLRDAMGKLARGLPFTAGGEDVDPSNEFYILALSPNAARLSVRMFLHSRFGDIVRNIAEHYERLRITGVERVTPIWKLLDETVLKVGGKSAATPSPQMSGDTLRAILTNGYYPATLYGQLQLRIRADRVLNGVRAAIIKAYLLKNTNSDIYKEVVKVELNENTTYAPYVLGRLFAVLEMIQEMANPVINATIKDKYFSSACATPASVFPTLMSLSEKHLRKLDIGGRTYCDKLRMSLTSMLTASYPAHQTLYDQGIFQLGYYHQRQKRFEKKDNTVKDNAVKNKNEEEN